MAIIQGNAKSSGITTFYPKVINGSLRFNDDDSAYLSWTPASAGNRKTWTWSGWVKRGTLGGNKVLFGAGVDGDTSTHDSLRFNVNDNLQFLTQAATGTLVATSAAFRDPSAWYHIVITHDSTESTSTDRVKIYVNGELQTISGTYPTLNVNTAIGNNVSQQLGARQITGSVTNYLDGYLANVHFIDGQALTASDFGETKNGVWVAKDYAGTFGTNGFYLTFEDDTQVEAFNTVLYRSNGGLNQVTGMGFKPDLLWIKQRSSTNSHGLVDSVRGVTKALASNSAESEYTYTNAIESFDNDGFTINGNNGWFNSSTASPYVAWGWKAGDSNVSNTDGTITSTVRANDTYGFSIVSYTGNGTTNATVGHGLSSAPDFVICKDRDTNTNNNQWHVYHSGAGDQYLYLSDTSAAAGTAAIWPNGQTNTLSVGDGGNYLNTNESGDRYIAYCWSETTGYSKFGSYIGNGSATGPTVTCGFKPAMVIMKRTDAAEIWVTLDNTRDTDGTLNTHLYPNLSSAEGTGTTRQITISDTGFQVAGTDTSINASGGTYIYAAFADTREAAFWLDQSGNDNDWQPVNLDHNDTVADSPTNNFATLNPLDEQGSANTLSDGNLVVNMAAAGSLEQTRATMGISSGQFYWEAEVLSSGSNGGYFRVGFKSPDHHAQGLSTSGAYWMVRGADGETEYMINNSGTQGTSSVSYGVGDIIMVAVDMDAGKWWVGVNGTWVGDPVAGTGAIHDNLYGTVIPFVSNATSAATHVGRVNFGQQPFKYDPPA